MAHHISVVNGKTEFATYRRPAWHGLGQVFEDDLMMQQGVELANLNWEVGKLPNIHRLQDGSEITSEKSFFTYRKDTSAVLGPHVGNSYEVIQHTNAFEIIDEVLKAGYHLETMGSLKGGNYVFAVVKMDEPLFINTEDHTDLYMLYMCAHNGKMAGKVSLTPVRVVCWNTLQASFRSVKHEINIRHSGNVEHKLREATRIINTFRASRQQVSDRFERMADHKFAARDFFDYIGSVFFEQKDIKEIQEKGAAAISTRKKNVIADIMDYAVNGPGQDGGKSAWTAYNAVTGYFANTKKYKTIDDRMWQLTNGTASHYMQKALAFADQPERIHNLSKELAQAAALN